MLGQTDLYASQEVVDYEESDFPRLQWGNVVTFMLAALLFLFLWILCAFILQSHMTTGYSLLLLFFLTISLFCVQQQFYGRQGLSSEYLLVNHLEPRAPRDTCYPYAILFLAVWGVIFSVLSCSFLIKRAVELNYDYTALWSDDVLALLVTLLLTLGLFAIAIAYALMLRDSPERFELQHIVSKLLAAFFFFLLVVLLSLSTYQIVTSSLMFYPPPGKLYWIQTDADSRNHKEHLYCVDNRTFPSEWDQPTILLFHGLGGQAMDFAWMQPALARHAKTCAFDRAGYGYSDESTQPRLSSRMAWELDLLLEKANMTGESFILVGHSMAGYNMRVFYNQTKVKVLGIVCIDCVDPDEQRIVGLGLHESVWRDLYFYGRILLPSGLLRLLGDFKAIPGNSSSIIDYLPLDVQPAYLQNILVDKMYDTQVNEWYNFPGCAFEAKQTGSLGDLPFIVISAGLGLNNTRLVRLSSASVLVSMPDCDHYLMFHQKWADVVTQQVLWLLANVTVNSSVN